ncbi:MAG: tetratricopeptide repeat protein [Caulobacterales bacterium]
MLRSGWTAIIVAVMALLAVACQPSEKIAAPPSDPRLDAMFADLKAASDAFTAEQAEQKIWAQWGSSGSPTVDILMERALNAEAAKENDLAQTYLTEATKLAPNYAEAWNRRAVIAFAAEDYDSTLKFIHETLKREPRHFGALAGLGVLYEQMGQNRAALAAYQEALAIHPFMEAAKQGVARLSPKLDGQDT